MTLGIQDKVVVITVQTDQARILIAVQTLSHEARPKIVKTHAAR